MGYKIDCQVAYNLHNKASRFGGAYPKQYREEMAIWAGRIPKIGTRLKRRRRVGASRTNLSELMRMAPTIVKSVPVKDPIAAGPIKMTFGTTDNDSAEWSALNRYAHVQLTSVAGKPPWRRQHNLWTEI